jgi:N-acetylglucosaminyl-diphospho-decaprenol L-rhamnosyltransferase
MMDVATASSRDDQMTGRDHLRRKTKDLSIVAVNFNTNHLLPRMMQTIRAAQGNLDLEIIVIDNASAEPPTALEPGIQLISNPSNVGFGRANNQALPMVRGRYVLLLNTDAFVAPDTLSKTIAYMDAHPRCGILGVKLVGEDGALQPSCRYFPTPWNDFLESTGLSRFFPNARLVDDFSWDHASERNCDWVPGCYYLIRREVIDQVGLFDPRYFLYFEEVDHCKASRSAGWDVTFYPHTQVIHLGGESAKSQGAITRTGRQLSALQIESKLLFYRKHYGVTGVAMACVLQAATCGLSAVKDIVRPKDERRRDVHIAEWLELVKILRATNYATTPTR